MGQVWGSVILDVGSSDRRYALIGIRLNDFADIETYYVFGCKAYLLGRGDQS